jgi:hypothetical protein
MTPETLTDVSGTLVWSSLPLANQALKTGGDVLRAAFRLTVAQDALEAHGDRPLPPEGKPREWAIERRAEAAARVREASLALRAVDRPYESLLDQIHKTAPAVAEAVEAAVWGTTR